MVARNFKAVPGVDNESLLVTQSGAGAVERTVQDKLRDIVSVKDFGAVGDGVTDDTAAIQAAIDSFGVDGGSLSLGRSKLYLASSITIKANVRVFGDFDHGQVDYSTQNYYNFTSQIKLGGGATVFLERNACLERLLIIRDGLYISVPSDPIAAQNVVAAFSGTAVQIGDGTLGAGNDASVLGCMLLGHTTGIFADKSDRITIDSVLIDCTNGVNIDESLDINRIYAVHCWPFLTANVSGVGNTPSNPAPNRRSGFGFKINNLCDWTSVIDCFAYGYSIGFWSSSTSNVSFIRCQSDYTNPNTGSIAGFKIDGTSTYTSLINCTSIAGTNGIIIDTTGGASADSAARISSCLFANSSECINVVNGNISCFGTTFHSGTYAVTFGASADASAVVGCVLDGVVSDFSFATEDIKRSISIVSNVYYNVSVTSPERLVGNNFIVQNVAAQLEIFDNRNITGGVGPEIVASQFFADGKQDSFKFAGNLVSAASGNEAVTLDFYVNRFGSLVKRMSLTHDGILILPNLPTSSAGLASGSLWNDGGTVKIIT